MLLGREQFELLIFLKFPFTLYRLDLIVVVCLFVMVVLQDNRIVCVCRIAPRDIINEH